MEKFYSELQSLSSTLLALLAVSLSKPSDFFANYLRDSLSTLRLLHYPKVKKSVFKDSKGQLRAGAHTDYGSITLLFQDSRGGLQVQSPSGTFVDATPIPDTIVVNAADLLARWSNDTIRSTLHRVVEPPAPEEGDEHPARYSIAYFCNPNFNKLIDAIPKTVSDASVRKYPAVNSGEYLVQRLTATY